MFAAQFETTRGEGTLNGRSSDKPKVGLITYTDLRWPGHGEATAARMQERHSKLVAQLNNLPLEVVAAEAPIDSYRTLYSQLDMLKACNVESVLAHVHNWATPSAIAQSLLYLDVPGIVYPDWMGDDGVDRGLGGLLAVSGSLAAVGADHLQLPGSISDEATAARLTDYATAAAVRQRLRRALFGLLGGKAIGMNTGTFDPVQWQMIFGVETVQVDQLDIIKRMEKLDEHRVDSCHRWLCDRARRIADEHTRDKLRWQTGFYLATKELIADRGFDFVALKCAEGIMAHYMAPCLTAAILPDPVDGEGEKEPMAVGCEADCDGALSMHMLKLISGGLPTLFFDIIADFGGGIYLGRNCGAMSTWYATRTNSAEANLGRTDFRDKAVMYTAAPGPVTVARLYRESLVYKAAIYKVEAVEPPASEPDSFNLGLYFQTDIPREKLLAGVGCHHMTGVAGDYVERMKHLCRFYNIELADL